LADADRQGGFMHFENYAEWQKFLLVFDLPPGVPGVVKDAFDRARKLYLLSWWTSISWWSASRRR
jgi:hypothetical protein